MHSSYIKLSKFCDYAIQFSFFATTNNDHAQRKYKWKLGFCGKGAFAFSLTMNSLWLECTTRTDCGNGYYITNQWLSVSRGQRQAEWKTSQEKNKGKESVYFSGDGNIFRVTATTQWAERADTTPLRQTVRKHSKRTTLINLRLRWKFP